jgi:hypothetical protein
VGAGGSDKKPMTKMAAALEQIEAAIVHFHAGKYACAITLAGAAEGQILHKEADHLWEVLKQKRPADQDEKQWLGTFNATRDWLKHATTNLGEERYIEEFDCVFMLTRASSKFAARYVRTSQAIDQFRAWCRQHGYLISSAPVEDAPGSNDANESANAAFESHAYDADDDQK